MSEDEHFPHHPDDDLIDYAELDDVSAVLAALQRLTEHSRHPVVRACLEQAYDDIVHLISHG